ncbi:asparaginase domain-containing protein [Allorhizobium pseudoryzae]|uniref:asparaginase domain-containing protein n=1 Tax=Allorhizobium pseudoryzae TaxID=379684 RepID=UPI003D00E8A1
MPRVASKISRIAHLAGPNATIQNTPPLVTSNKARVAHGLAPIVDADGNPSRFDVLRAQRLAAPATVYVEQFSAHPLEADAADLYADPDGYVTPDGSFHETRQTPEDKPVYRVEIRPEDGVYPLPYMVLKKDGTAWETDGVAAVSPRDQSRQPFMPDGSRLFEEVDRLGVDDAGHGNTISDIADVDFFRVAPSGGFTKGLSGAMRADGGSEDIEPELAGRDFFPYRPNHLNMSPSRMVLAKITNMAQRILGSGDYDGAIWTQGSPRIEETIYWLSLVLDVTVPVCGNASQRYHGQISNDGPKNLADSTEFIHSRCWADTDGRNRVGAVLVQDQRVFAARDVVKVDARPGGYSAAGGHGGILGAAGSGVGSVMRYVPATMHTHLSEVNITRPAETNGLLVVDGELQAVAVAVKSEAGELLASAIPKVSIVKDASYTEDDYFSDPEQEVDVKALIAYTQEKAPLAGFVHEGLNPYGKPASTSKARIMAWAAFSGFPVVMCGRGNTEGFAYGGGPFIAGSNLTSVKARILLMLCLMKFGMLPPAADPDRPTDAERQAVMSKLADYQAVLNTH